MSVCTGAPDSAGAVNPSVASSASTWRRSVVGRTRWIFSQRSLRGGGLAVEPKPPGGEQPEGDDDCLVVAQHEGREPVAGADPVTAADTALTLDRDAELLERRDVAPHGARADLEPLADLAPGDQGLCLQQLEQREQP